jgi:AGCS family alanine or glycine:cation symporter
VGSLAGVALSIYIGGPGSIFWMWIATFLVVPNAYAESYLGVLYHQKEEDIYIGGPSYYISKGLNNKWLGNVYAFLVLIAYIFGFLTIQSNTISKSFELFNIPPILVGIALAITVAMVLIKGAKGIISVSSKIMPFIGIIYLGSCFFIIMNNINLLPIILNDIITSAFNVKSLGSGVITSLIIGFQRGIFSNEAGVGSGAIAAATVDNDNARGQGMIQMLGIYFTTLILCSLTAIVIMMTKYSSAMFKNVNGIELTQYALTYHLGTLGEIILVLTIFIFAFSTIISGYYYGENSLRFLKKRVTKIDIILLKLVTLFLLIIGSISKSSILWNTVDILVAIMAIINTYALFKLRKKLK